jgi:hypothetical protein
MRSNSDEEVVLHVYDEEVVESCGDQTLRKSTAIVSMEGGDNKVHQLTGKSRIDLLESLVDLLSDFGASKNNLATDEDEKDNLRFDHAVDETREQLRLVRAEMMMPACKTLETNGKLDIARANNVLNLEVGELGIEPKLLNDSSIFA